MQVFVWLFGHLTHLQGGLGRCRNLEMEPLRRVAKGISWRIECPGGSTSVLEVLEKQKLRNATKRSSDREGTCWFSFATQRGALAKKSACSHGVIQLTSAMYYPSARSHGNLPFSLLGLVWEKIRKYLSISPAPCLCYYVHTMRMWNKSSCERYRNANNITHFEMVVVRRREEAFHQHAIAPGNTCHHVDKK